MGAQSPGKTLEVAQSWEMTGSTVGRDVAGEPSKGSWRSGDWRWPCVHDPTQWHRRSCVPCVSSQGASPRAGLPAVCVFQGRDLLPDLQAAVGELQNQQLGPGLDPAQPLPGLLPTLREVHEGGEDPGQGLTGGWVTASMAWLWALEQVQKSHPCSGRPGWAVCLLGLSFPVFKRRLWIWLLPAPIQVWAQAPRWLF